MPPATASSSRCLPSGDIGGSCCLFGFGQVAVGVEGEGVVLVEVAVEDAAVLGALDLDARLGGHFDQQLFGMAEPVAGSLHHAVVVADVPAEEQYLLLGPLGGGKMAKRERRQPQQGGRSGLEHVAAFHGLRSPEGKGGGVWDLWDGRGAKPS